MKRAFHSVKVMNVAAVVRTAMWGSTVFPKLKAFYDQSSREDDAPLSGLVNNECSAYDTPAIVNTMQRALDHAFLPDSSHDKPGFADQEDLEEVCRLQADSLYNPLWV